MFSVCFQASVVKAAVGAVPRQDLEGSVCAKPASAWGGLCVGLFLFKAGKSFHKQLFLGSPFSWLGEAKLL